MSIQSSASYLSVLLFAFSALVAVQSSTVSLSINALGGKTSLFDTAIFLEANINRGDDGGLYAELIYNRAFQENGGSTDGWVGIGNTTLSLETGNPLSWAIPRSVTPSLPSSATNSTLGFYNYGKEMFPAEYKYMPLTCGWFQALPVNPVTYTLSFWARSNGISSSKGDITVGLWDASLSTAYATARIPTSKVTTKWKEFTVTLRPTTAAPTASNVFAILLPRNSAISFTLISLFPPTWKHMPNGLRPDLAQAMADIKPKYIRWPGGNDLEGNSIADRFNWSATIGPLKDRPGRAGTWVGWATTGLGLMEMADWAERANCKLLLGLYAGYSLDGSSVANTTALDPYIQDVLNELHFMVDAPGTSQWAKLRAQYGHREPYDLDTLEIGNEDFIGHSPSTYPYRYQRFSQAINKEFGNGRFQLIATNLGVAPGANAVDLHDYLSTKDMINTYSRYDSYARSDPSYVYALEYAVINSWSDMWQYPQLAGSVAEFIYNLGMERNGDLVKAAAYAPLFYNTPKQASQWHPDLIAFNATGMAPSTSYWVQLLFGQSRVDTILNVTTSSQPGPVYWSAGSADASKTYYLKLANAGTDAVTVVFDFSNVAATAYKGSVSMLSAPTGHDQTVANTIDAPNLVTPKSSTASISVSGGVARGSIILPGWGAVVVKLTAK